MRATLVIDEKLLEQAREITGLRDDAAVVDRALEALVQRAVARRLIELGGSAPGIEAPPRRRFDAE